MKRQYPAFIIDRSRRAEASRFSDDFIVCPDKEVGFIARVYTVPKSRRDEFRKMIDALPFTERCNSYYIISISDTIVVLQIVKMLYEPVAHINRLRPLMKKAMRAYLYGEVSAIQGDGTPYDEQIAAVDDLLRTMLAQYDHIVDVTGKVATDRRIAATAAAVDSLKLLKKIVKNE